MYLRVILIVIFIICFPSKGSVSDIQPKEFRAVTIISYSLYKHIDEKETRDRSEFVKLTAKNLNHRYYFMNYKLGDSEAVLSERAKLIDEEIQKFKPDIIMTYGNSAFEYYVIKIAYQRKQTNTIFYCVPDYFYLGMTKKYDLGNSPVQGIIQRYDFNFVNDFLSMRNIRYEKIILIRNRRYQEDQLIAKINTFAIDHSIKLDVIKVDTDGELTNALKIARNESERSLIVFATPFITDKYKNELTDSEIAFKIKQYNLKHIELALFRNLSKHGVGLSYIPFVHPERLNHPQAPCNQIFHNIYNKIPLASTILMNNNVMVVNSKRLEKLGLESILKDTNGIDTIYE